MSDNETAGPAYALWNVYGIGDERPVVDEGAIGSLSSALEAVSSDGVVLRGLYDVSGLRAGADLMVWLQGGDRQHGRANTMPCRPPLLSGSDLVCLAVVELHLHRLRRPDREHTLQAQGSTPEGLPEPTTKVRLYRSPSLCGAKQTSPIEDAARCMGGGFVRHALAEAEVDQRARGNVDQRTIRPRRGAFLVLSEVRPSLQQGSDKLHCPLCRREVDAVLIYRLHSSVLDPTGDAAGTRHGGRGWDADTAEAFADRILAEAEEHLPGLTGLVMERHLTTPADLARQNPNAGPGDHAAGENSLAQAFVQRPLPAHGGGYRTAVPGVWLIGAATWPGAGINGTSGRAVAQTLIG